MAQSREPPYVLNHYNVKFTAGPGTKNNPYDAAPQEYDGVPKKLKKGR